MIPKTTERVTQFTDKKTDRAIKRGIYEHVREYAAAHPTTIDRRIDELEREWDLDRIATVVDPLIVMTGLGLGYFVRPAWFLLSLGSSMCLMTHGLLGWHPLLMFLRRRGRRCASEIACEKYALKALRGDFNQLALVQTPNDREAVSSFENEGGMASGPPVLDAADPEPVAEALRAVQR